MYNLHIFKFSKNKSGHLFQKLCFPPAHQNLRKILVPYFSKFYQKRNYLYEKKRNYSDRFLRENFCVWFFTGTIYQNVLLGFIILPIGHIYMHYSLYTMVVVSNYVENSCVMKWMHLLLFHPTYLQQLKHVFSHWFANQSNRRGGEIICESETFIHVIIFPWKKPFYCLVIQNGLDWTHALVEFPRFFGINLRYNILEKLIDLEWMFGGCNNQVQKTCVSWQKLITERGLRRHHISLTLIWQDGMFLQILIYL